MKFNFKLHQLMWQNLARNPLHSKSEIIDIMYDNQDITFDEKKLLKNSVNNCLACQYSIEMIKEISICVDFEKPHVLCCYCPFKIKNQSSEDCLDGLYAEYVKYRKRYIDLCINISDRLERSAALHQVKNAALQIANHPLKESVILENRNGL